METLSTEKLSMILLDDIRQKNQRFVQEAIRDWDLTPGYVGLFADYIKAFVRISWQQMVSQN